MESGVYSEKCYGRKLSFRGKIIPVRFIVGFLGAIAIEFSVVLCHCFIFTCLQSACVLKFEIQIA